jgi:methionyl-tRNA formyltransferase
MNITILNTMADHPVNTWLEKWMEKHQINHNIDLLRSKNDLVGGDILFLISCSELISKQNRAKFKKTLVIHASDLPIGRGWSPHIWEIINGAEQITLSLLEAEDKVDSGDIWTKVKVKVPKAALYNQINVLIFDAELELMDFAVAKFYDIDPRKQFDDSPTYWPKRTPKDSEIDIQKSISGQFDLIRVCDPERFPTKKAKSLH